MMTQTSSPVPPEATDRIQQMAMRLKKYRRRWYFMGLLVIVCAGSGFFFQQNQSKKNRVAQSEMFQAVYYFERGSFDKAMYGDGICTGLLDIVREYRFTQAANLAHFYIGTSYLHQKDYEKAIQHLAKFRAKDLLLQARSWSLIGDAYAEQENYQKASDYYMRAAAYKPNKVFTPIYLVKAALAYEADKNYRAALGCYQRIIRKFPEATQYGEAVKHVARLEIINMSSQPSPK